MEITSQKLSEKLLFLLIFIYWENAEGNKKILEIFETLSDEEKLITFNAFFECYESITKSSKQLLQDIQQVNWELEEVIDKIEAENMQFNF